ncbi:MAG: hypothetical protein WCW61_01325 [Patescibacteria group bacterium]|jgi:phosphoribosylformylglycinamidine cyclo-ligase
MESKKDLYQELGVASDKSGIKANFDEIIAKEYPYAFVNIVTDPYEDSRAVTLHLDGDGSKFIQRLLDYYEHGDENVFAGMMDDALTMNLGDVAASGFVFGPMLIADVIDQGLNPEIKAIVLRQVKKRFQELLQLYAKFGFNVKIKFMGGETADLPYQVKSLVFNVAVNAWEEKVNIVTGETKPGDIIIGVQSDGQAAWEDKPNSGGMSNGQTLLRSGAMDLSFNEKYPDLGDGHFYKGHYRPHDKPEILEGMSVGEALLSPTRQWAIVIREIIKELKNRGIFHMLHGITMNTGGGATKIKNIGKAVIYSKTMPEPPALFRFIQAETGQPWRHMYTSCNCGIGIDIVGEDNEEFKNAVKGVVFGCCLKPYELGFVFESTDDENHVTLNTPYGKFEY